MQSKAANDNGSRRIMSLRMEMGAGLKNPIRHGPTGCARRCAREDLTTAKITPHRPTSSEKTPRQVRHLPRGPGLPQGLEGRCSIQLSYRRVLVFCEVSGREASFSVAWRAAQRAGPLRQPHRPEPAPVVHGPERPDPRRSTRCHDRSDFGLRDLSRWAVACGASVAFRRSRRAVQ